jgi:predicted GH43/DUF377 family glycosyl hydrolase
LKRRAWFKQVVLASGLALALLGVLGGQQPLAVAAPHAPESGADWEGLSASSPTVISAAGKYHMWYQGTGLNFYNGNRYALGYAESGDGKAWAKSAANPVLRSGESGTWDDLYRGQVAVIYDGGLYKMWYSGGRSSGAWQVGYATSANGLDWTIHAGNPVLPAGGPGSWDEQDSVGPTVIKDGDTYKMWYYGCNADYTVCSIGYATSLDGIVWTKFAGNPVLRQGTTGEWDASGLGWPRVIKNGATYEMWYRSDSKIGRATSSNGTDWTKYAGNPVLSTGWDGAGVGLSSVLLDGGTYKMWTTSGTGATRGIGYFESADGIVWTQPVANPILQSGETGVIIDANYYANAVDALTLADTAITITVSNGGVNKATISGVTDAGGQYQSHQHNGDWDPSKPNIEPGDTVSATAGSYSTSIETVGEIDARAHSNTDRIEGTIHAPGFAPGTLSVLCEVYADPSQKYLDTDVPAAGGSFACDFSGIVDIVSGQFGTAGYLEPDGDMVSTMFTVPYMVYLPLALKG